MLLNELKKDYKKVYVFSTGIYNNQEIRELLKPLEMIKVDITSTMNQEGFVLVWGRKPNTKIPEKIAKRKKIKIVYMEDGFIRSYGLGKTGAKAKSFILDDIGIYYDSTKPSRLETICNLNNVSKLEQEYSRILIKDIIDNKISKYNNSLPLDDEFKEKLSNDKKNVLIIGQVEGDMSLKYGKGKYSFEKIIKIAKKENPESEIYFKIHPDLLLGKYKKISRVNIIEDNYNPIELIKYFDKVYTKTSQMGFEALMMGKKVVCYGMPFYAGWGLTDDRVKCSRRKVKLNIESLFYNAYIKYPEYLSSIETTISDLIELKNKEKSILVYGVSNWKRNFLSKYFKENETLVYLEEDKLDLNIKLKKNKEILIWGMKSNKELEEYSKNNNIKIRRVEDGFLRSISLGIEKSTPGSLCFDKKGMYYDSTKESELEYLLNTYECSDELLKRAKRLREKIVENKLSKYNKSKHLNFDDKYGKKIKNRVLVVGQVEGDMSLRYGYKEAANNNELVKLAVKENPDCDIYYKIHPDVIKSGKDNPDEIKEICHIIRDNYSIDTVLETMDKVYTMTSLMGMESLIREKEVVCMGIPFYSGWGLTEDKMKCSRRKRLRTIDELFAIVYLVYPTYYDIKNNEVCEIEKTIDNLINDYKDIVIDGKKDKSLNKNNFNISKYERFKKFCKRNYNRLIK